MRGTTFSRTGRARGSFSTRTGSACARYFRTVLRAMPISRATRRTAWPSTSTLCRTTLT